MLVEQLKLLMLRWGTVGELKESSACIVGEYRSEPSVEKWLCKAVVFNRGSGSAGIGQGFRCS